MSMLAQDQTLMGVASKEVEAATAVLPPVAMIAFQFSLCTGNAANIDGAGQKWREAADQIGKAIQDLQESVASISYHDWSADDRTAYEQKVKQLCAQLAVMQELCMTIGVTLTVFAYALLAYAIFAAAMGTFLAALAAVAFAAACGIITAEITAECEAIAASCVPIVSAATTILAGVSQVAAMIFQGGATIGALAEYFKGDKQAFSDLRQAEIDGSATALANLGQNAINAGLAWVNRGVGKGSPLQQIDIDADKDKDGTWDVGGGATIKLKNENEVTAGGHVLIGNHGFEGGGVEGEYKSKATGWSGSGQVGYQDDDGIGRGKDGTLSYEGKVGKENPIFPGVISGPKQADGHTPEFKTPDIDYGASAGISGKYNFDNHSGNVETSGGAEVNGNSVAEDKYNVSWDQHGKVTGKSEVDTPFYDFGKADE